MAARTCPRGVLAQTCRRKSQNARRRSDGKRYRLTLLNKIVSAQVAETYFIFIFLLTYDSIACYNMIKEKYYEENKCIFGTNAI